MATFKRLFRRGMPADAGRLVINIALVAIAFAFLCATLLLPTRNTDKTALVMLTATLIAAGAWCVRQTLLSAGNWARLRIVEILSFGQPHSRDALEAHLKRESAVIRMLPDLLVDALAGLVEAGRVTVDSQGRYVLGSREQRAPES